MEEEIITTIKSLIPPAVIIAVVTVVLITEATKEFFSKIEKIVEEKKGKEVKFFDHTKIIFSIFWSAILDAVLAIAGIYTWKEYLMYLFMIIGAANVLYELILRRIKKLAEGE